MAPPPSTSTTTTTTPKVEEAAKVFGVQVSKDIGNEHQGIKYNAAHYDGNDEEAEMLRSLNNRETIRYNMGI
jgi:hypothetical protein